MDDLAAWVPPVLSLLAAATGALGGLGGAVLFVPVLVALGMDPAEAASLGLLTVAAGSLAAGARQVESRLLNHRLGVVLETPAALGASVGAALAGVIRPGVLEVLLATVSGLSGVSLLRRRHARLPQPAADVPVGECVGSLAGAYEDTHGLVSYEAARLGVGVAVFGAVGLIAGLTGTSGGYLKTPIMAGLMRVPVKVAAATTVFMVGVTVSAALVVVMVQGRVDPVAAGPVVVGALLGGRIGASAQALLPERAVRRFLGVVLVAVSLVVLTT